MSRIGKKPIEVPAGVKVAIDDCTVRVEGPQGKLEWTHRPELTSTNAEAAKQVVVTRQDDLATRRALHG